MQWFEKPEEYTDPRPVPAALEKLAGPHGVALVDVYGEGRTSRGWGLEPREGTPGFMENYEKDKFWAKPRILAAVEQQKPFAFVMRSMSVVALDIDRHTDDGAPDGFVAARKLGLPPTLAQTSKSGKGRHLFYRTDDPWDPETGHAPWADAIGILPGIDVRAVGCIYRHASQRWNTRPVAPLPQNLRELLDGRRDRKVALHTALAAAAAAPDSEEALIMHDTLIRELAAPIQAGKRNTTLFAIGSKMAEAEVPDWDQKVLARAVEIGLDQDEGLKIVENIRKYN